MSSLAMSHDREELPSCSMVSEALSIANYRSAEKLLRQSQQNDKLSATLGFIKANSISDSRTETPFDTYPQFLQCLCDCLHPELYHFTCSFSPEALRPFLVLNLCDIRNALIARNVAFTEHYSPMLFFHFAMLSEKPLQEVFISAWKLLNQLTLKRGEHSDQIDKHSRVDYFTRMFEGLTLLIHSCILFLVNRAYCEKGLSILTFQTLNPEHWLAHFAEASCDETLKLVRVACAHLFKTLTTDRQFAIHCAENLICLYVNISLAQRWLKELCLDSIPIDKAQSLLQEIRRWCSRALDCIFENVSFEQKCQKMISATLMIASPWVDIVNQQSISHSELSKVITEVVDDAIACLVFHLTEEEIAANLGPGVHEYRVNDENQSLCLRLGLASHHFGTLFDYLFRYIQAVLLSTNAPNESKLEFTRFSYIASIYLHSSGMTGLSLHLVEKYYLPFISYTKTFDSDSRRFVEMAVCSIIGHSDILSHPTAHQSMQTYLQILCLLGRHQSPFFHLCDCDCTLSKDVMRNLSLPRDACVGLLLNYSASCPLYLWKTAFCDYTLSIEHLIQLAEAFQNHFSIRTQDLQKAVRIELGKLPNSTSTSFWKVNEAFVSTSQKVSGTVDQKELIGVIEGLANSVVSRLSQDSLILISSFLLLLPLHCTFKALQRIEAALSIVHSDAAFEHVPLIQAFRKCSRIVSTHDSETDAVPENCVSDITQLKDHLDKICTLCKQHEKILGDTIMYEMEVFLSTTLLCFV